MKRPKQTILDSLLFTFYDFRLYRVLFLLFKGFLSLREIRKNLLILILLCYQYFKVVLFVDRNATLRHRNLRILVAFEYLRILKSSSLNAKWIFLRWRRTRLRLIAVSHLDGGNKNQQLLQIHYSIVRQRFHDNMSSKALNLYEQNQSESCLKNYVRNNATL